MSIIINKIKANNVFLKGKNISQVYLKKQKVFPEEVVQDLDYLCITYLTSGTLQLHYAPYFQYSLNKKSWYDFDSESTFDVNQGGNLSAGTKIYIRCSQDNTCWKDIGSSNNGLIQSGSAKIKISGNILSLMYKDFSDKTEIYNSTEYCFQYLFADAKNLQDVTELKLPMKTITSNCCKYMFASSGITSLPKDFLPATYIASYGYTFMFYGCSSLVTCDFDLPNSNLEDSAYRAMFYKCSSLTKAPNILSTVAGKVVSNGIQTITTYATWLCSSMFRECTSLTGNIPQINFTEKIGEYTYAYMFDGCTGITSANIKAKTLSTSSLAYMFRNCTSLTTIYTNQQQAPSSTYSSNWLQNTKGGTFYRSASWTVSTKNNSTVPSQWTIKTF